MACSASCFLFPVLRKGQRRGGWAQGMRGKVGVKERGQPQDSRGEWLREVGLGRWEQTAKSGAGGSSVPTGLFWGRNCRCNLRSPQLAPMGGSCREANCVSQYKLFPTGRVSCPPMGRW